MIREQKCMGRLIKIVSCISVLLCLYCYMHSKKLMLMQRTTARSMLPHNMSMLFITYRVNRSSWMICKWFTQVTNESTTLLYAYMFIPIIKLILFYQKFPRLEILYYHQSIIMNTVYMYFRMDMGMQRVPCLRGRQR